MPETAGHSLRGRRDPAATETASGIFGDGRGVAPTVGMAGSEAAGG